MTFHLYGNILTDRGTAANNRGENEGNITTLQKLFWQGDVHTTVSAEAIRWALRYYWQIAGDAQNGCQVNRQWNDETNDNEWQDKSFDEATYIDDDVLGFMRAEAAKQDGSDNGGKKAKGTTTARRGVLEVTRAVSTMPFAGDITFNAASGEKIRTSLYGTEVHATRYQYGFALTPSRLQQPERTLATLDGLISLGEVAGNHSRFLFDFSPHSLVLRWTHDCSPRFLYCFSESETGEISADALVRRARVGDIDPSELWIAGAIADTELGQTLHQLGATVRGGVKSAVGDLQQRIREDLQV